MSLAAILDLSTQLWGPHSTHRTNTPILDGFTGNYTLAVKCFRTKEKFILHRKYVSYFNKTNITVFTIPSAVKLSKYASL